MRNRVAAVRAESSDNNKRVDTNNKKEKTNQMKPPRHVRVAKRWKTEDTKRWVKTKKERAKRDTA